MKVNCSKKSIDINKIHWAIDKFTAEHFEGDKPSYIIINYETKAELVDNYYYNIALLSNEKGVRKEDTLFGIPVAYNEGLEFGEIDIV